MTLRLSVVMAVHEGRDCVEEAARSILEQDFRGLELIVVDDGSTDGTHDILETLRRDDSRVRVIRQENRGLTAALIRGCSMARGEYVGRQDADDISLPGRLAAQVALLEANDDVALVSCWADHLGPGGELLHTIRRPTDPAEATEKLVDRWEGVPAHGSVVFRRSVYEQVGGYRACFYYAQDSDLWLRMVEHGLLAYVPEVLYRARYTPEGISAARRAVQKRFGDLGRAAHDARARGLDEEPILEEARRLTERVRAGDPSIAPSTGETARGYYFMASNLAARSPEAASPYFWEAVKADPLFLRAWLRLAWCLLGRVLGRSAT